MDMSRKFHVVIQRDEDGIYIGKVPELKGCMSQGKTIQELMKNMKEAIELCLDVQQEDLGKFVGVREIEIV
ncbi:type II toxin-antitoxin system HicB family antitoxin [Candidatus Woesearchaeota archaeon]|nr:type II toxin-antitoxin system HicB family antitoxin [Candidatus Woesearchaeota archaeon]